MDKTKTDSLNKMSLGLNLCESKETELKKSQ
jgi:hypothetical protein